MITIEVVLFATFRKYNPYAESSEPFQLSIPAGSKVESLFEKLALPPHEGKLVFVNNSPQGKNYLLQEGDRVAIFPPIAGG